MPLDPTVLAAHSEPAPRSQRAASPSSADLDGYLEAEGASHLKPVVEAIYGQESGSGRTNATSVDGARGGMQIIPATFNRLARDGERIDNPDDNMRVGIRYIKQLGDRFGNDPARIAAGYFSGEGNVTPSGDTPYKADRADGNGKRVSGYVQDVLGRIGNAVIPSAQADERGGRSSSRLDQLESLRGDAGIALARELAGYGSGDATEGNAPAGTEGSGTPAPRKARPSLLDDLKKAVNWRKGEDIKAPEGVTDATFSAGIPTAKELSERNGQALTETQGEGPQMTPIQRLKNSEIDKGRRLIEGMEPAEIKQRAASDKTFAAYARLAGERKVGPDDWFDQADTKHNAPATGRDDPIQRFAADKAMAGNTLGRHTARGIEVLDSSGKLIGHWE